MKKKQNGEPKALKYPFLYGFLDDQEDIPMNGSLWAKWQSDLEESLKGCDEKESLEIFAGCLAVLRANLKEHLKKPFDEPLPRDIGDFSRVISRPEELQNVKATTTKSYEMRIEYFQKKSLALKPKRETKEIEVSKQVLAIYYLFEAAGGDLGLNYRADLARFIQFLTGRELDNPKIGNTNIYKKVKSLFGKNETRNAKNLEAIKPFFEKLGLEKIAQTIEREMVTKK